MERLLNTHALDALWFGGYWLPEPIQPQTVKVMIHFEDDAT